MTITSLSRLVLVPDPRPAAASAAPVRRYRLARVRSPGLDPRDRFAHLKRTYD